MTMERAESGRPGSPWTATDIALGCLAVLAAMGSLMACPFLFATLDGHRRAFEAQHAMLPNITRMLLAHGAVIMLSPALMGVGMIACLLARNLLKMRWIAVSATLVASAMAILLYELAIQYPLIELSRQAP